MAPKPGGAISNLFFGEGSAISGVDRCPAITFPEPGPPPRGRARSILSHGLRGPSLLIDVARLPARLSLLIGVAWLAARRQLAAGRVLLGGQSFVERPGKGAKIASQHEARKLMRDRINRSEKFFVAERISGDLPGPSQQPASFGLIHEECPIAMLQFHGRNITKHELQYCYCTAGGNMLKATYGTATKRKNA